MSTNSDHKTPSTNINELLPEVYGSDVNHSTFEMAFNRHLTKDDTARVAGFIGQGNPQALVDRQIKEVSPHRQAFQLAPTMFTTVGTVTSALSYKAFQGQLSLMGVDMARMQEWGDTTQFNWAPPVNIDMLINYQDYFWKTDNSLDAPQYFTIENRCNKAQSKVESYRNVLTLRGDTFAVISIGYADDTFVVANKVDDLFAPGFQFYTDTTTNPNLLDKQWTVASSSYDFAQNLTTIAVVESVASAGLVPPVSPYVLQWWYDTATTLKEWNGVSWVFAIQEQSFNIDLTRQLATYTYEANCVCSEAYGWDATAWDGTPNPSGIPTFGIGEGSEWDFSSNCVAQELNQWSTQNKWIHKSQVQSFADVRRAQVPILEYNSTVELNEWTELTYSWKYRESIDVPFASVTNDPTRFELEPIKGYVVENVSGVWTVFLFSQTATVNRDVDHTSTFVPGFKFRFTDDFNNSTVYTVGRSEYRQTVGTDPGTVTAVTGLGYMCTVVEMVESTFIATAVSGGIANSRIEPVVTSMGQTWRGYHVHWVLDQAATEYTATSNQPWNYFLRTSIESPPPAVLPPVGVHFDDATAFQPMTSTIVIGDGFQEQTMSFAGITQVDLLDKFRYNPAVPGFYATPGSNELRVYINNVRQYANYTEVVGIAAPSYTLVGSTAQSTQSIQYVKSVIFNTALTLFDVVRLEVGPASMIDMGMFCVPVRTVEDETAFTLATLTGLQPTYTSLSRYQKIEQSKRFVNEYPQFNVYDVVTSQVIKAAPLFEFNESSTSPINSATGKRIVASSDGKEYQFKQTLLDRDDNLLYAYRNQIDNNLAYWYSPLLQTVKFWDGKAWSLDIVVPVSGGVGTRRAVIASLPPAELLDVVNALWLDTTTNTLYQRVGAAWVVITDLVVNDTDPSLQTIWRAGTNPTYVPEYVDKDRQPVSIGDPLGDWEVADQWAFNSEHHNREIVNYSQIITHFVSMLAGQPKIPGLLGGGAYTLTQNQLDYGLGGTIKEHNDSYDTLISAVNVTNATPISVIEFAQQGYSGALLAVRDLFNKSIDETFTSYTPDSLRDFTAYLSDYVIDRYENNDYTAQIYGDSSTYDPITKVGIQNWIATCPMFGLQPRRQPYLTVSDTGVVQLFHHDGHRTTVEYTPGEFDKFARIVCKAVDPRGGTFGKISTSTPPMTQTDVTTAFGYFRPSMYWYRYGVNRSFFRFTPYTIGSVGPSFYDEQGAEIADGIRYYNTSTLATYEKVGLSWVMITAPGAGDVSPLWESVDFSLILGEIQLEAEQRLFDVTPVRELAFDYSTLTPTPANQELYTSLMRDRFSVFLSTAGITTPFTNSEYLSTNAFTWNYAGSSILTPPRGGPAPVTPAAWQELYTRWYGTPYPHLEPWTMQGFADKPTWWDDEYLDTSGTRRWIYNHGTLTGMWENIRTGQVPAGRTYPNGAVSTGNAGVDGQSLTTYLYFSVNISDGTIPGGYTPDALLPPYYDNSAIAGPLPTVRSIFNVYSSEINAPDADYVFGDVGPAEWAWTVSSQYPYDRPVVAFLMQPVRFMHYTFGPSYTLVNQLQVETTFNQVYSHEDVLFHGDVYNTDQTYLVRGLNQWYVNFNRFTGTDTNGEFRQLWAGWDPKLTYQTGGIVDTSTFEISSKYFDVINQDFQIILANSGVIRDMWVDAFEVSLINIPPALVQYNNQAAWKFELDVLASTPRDIKYYGVKSYQFVMDPNSNIGTAFVYPMMYANSPSRRFGIEGDHTAVFTPDAVFTVSGSIGNDGTYTVTSSVFETTTNRTRINVLEPIAFSNAGGVLSLPKALPWVTGDQVVISSSKFLPAPLLPNIPYYVIKLTSNTFKLAETPEEAIGNVAIDLTSPGDGLLRISQVNTSFYVFGGQGNTQDLWYHYALDTTDVRTITPPYVMLGMQTLINVMDGYAAYQRASGIVQNLAVSTDFDPDTGRQIDWAVETERFIDWAYGLRQARVTVSDQFPVTVDTVTDQVTFGVAVPQWLTGTAVAALTTGELPSPLILGSPYYVINTGTPGVIRLSVSADPNDVSSYVDITTGGSGQMSLGVYNKNRAYPRFEMNAARNNMWVDTPLGVLSDVIAGPYSDIRVNQTIFDQYSRQLGPDTITVYREDQRSHITIRPQLENDVDKIYQGDPYNYIHMGGAHMFVEGYEHYLVFNDYTVGNSLLYDSFLGLQTTKFNLDYFEKEQYTLRPTLGGYYLLDQQFKRNIEGSASDMQNYYDALELSETSSVARRSRALVGYKGRTPYLDFLNINSKSQFLFYRGMIQTKGSVNSVKAYINSRRFVDAKLDEFWAWKVAEFGDSRIRVYPEIKLFTTDGALDDVRFEFLSSSELETDEDVVDAKYKGFQVITFQDEDRWSIFPEQKEQIKSPLFLDTEVSSLTLVHASDVPPPPGAEITIKYWFDKSTNQLFAYNSSTLRWDIPSTAGRAVVQNVIVSPLAAADYLYYRVDQPMDDVRVIRRAISTVSITIGSTIVGTDTFTLPIDVDHPMGDFTSEITVGVPFAVNGSTTNDGTYYPTSVVFNQALSRTEVTVLNPDGSPPGLTFSVTPGLISVQDFATYSNIIFNAGSGVSEVTKVDSEVIRFNLGGFQDVMLIFTLNPARSKLSPAKLLDVKSHTVVQQLPLWDPARGSHSTVAIHNVDLQTPIDPGRYLFTPNPLDTEENFWNEPEVGTVWLNTAELGYLPYYDDQVYPDINDRLYNWGKLAPWGNVKVYTWVKSTVPPSSWDDQVISQASDSSIPANTKSTGTPRKPVFKRVREASVVTSNYTTDRITMSPLLVADGDEVLFTTTDTLPVGIEEATKYVVANISGTTFQLRDVDTEEIVDIIDNGVGTLTLVPAFKATNWNTQSLIRDHVTAPYTVHAVRTSGSIVAPITWPYTVPTILSESLPRIQWTPTNFGDWVLTGVGADTVDVYVNGVLRDAGLPISNTGGQLYVNVTAPLTLNESDIIDIVRPIHSVTAAELTFNPDVEDDGTQMIQWKEDYQYSSNTFTFGGTNTGSTSITYYYFWVENTTTRNLSDNTSLSGIEIGRQLETIPTPYFVVQRPKDDTYLVDKYGYGMVQYGSVFSLGILTDLDYQIPVLYREAIIRKVSSYINDDNRYTIRFTRDWALRDDLQANGKQMNLKEKHESWYMFRKEQTSTIPRELWDRMVESLIGYKLSDVSIRVPSLERELYDATYGTDTRFGLGVDQAFVDKTLGLSTIISYLSDPKNDFSPTDIDAFFANYSFDTPANIATALDIVYSTFSSTHVNAMWFETLSDALSTRAKYKELMKTSWIALHGIRVLEVGGLFDD